MSMAKRKEQWAHTAEILALLANIYRDRKRRSRPFTPADFHPLLADTPPVDEKVDVDVLKTIFVDRASETCLSRRQFERAQRTSK